jgi:predicted GTPase
MTAAQRTLDFDTPVPKRRRHLKVATPPLTLEQATEQARRALIDAGLKHQVSRVLTWPAEDRPGHLFTVALPRVGADAGAVADVLGGLPGADVWRGIAAVAVWRAT